MPIYLICYGVSIWLAAGERHLAAGLCLLAAAAYLYLSDYRKTKNPLHLRALFSLFWVGGEGISCLKLSRLQGAWSALTWTCFFAALVGFRAGYLLLERRGGRRTAGAAAARAGKPGIIKAGTAKAETAEAGAAETGISGRKEETAETESARAEAEPGGGTRKISDYSGGLRLALYLLTAVSALAFCIEAAVLGYVPFLVRGVPHAYSYFHISGLHYFTVSCVLVPPLGVLLFWSRYGRLVFLRPSELLAVFVSLAIPVLCVSRFQLIFAVFLAVLTYMTVSGRRRLLYLAGAAAALVPLYVILTIARSHDVAYLNGIFEMKNAATPIFITQPYMYIANNYDNFNCLVEQLPGFTLGIKGLFPLWALTGLKFRYPELAAYPLYTTKEELTTVTLFYDAYYDFGLPGVLLFSALLGAFAFWLMRRQREGKNPAWQLLYAQAALYFMLSFFTTWYSNPTTWFYFAATAAIAVFLEAVRRYSGRAAGQPPNA